MNIYPFYLGNNSFKGIVLQPLVSTLQKLHDFTAGIRPTQIYIGRGLTSKALSVDYKKSTLY